MKHKKFSKTVFLFHRDLRLHDNLGLIQALKDSQQVIPVFILDEMQVSDKNKYRSLKAIDFMRESLTALNSELGSKKSQLYFFCGKTVDILSRLIKNESVQAIYSNRDYTPFSRSRDESIGALCQESGVEFLIYDDALLTTPESVHKEDGAPYTIFTPFFKKARQLVVAQPQVNDFENYFSDSIPGAHLSHLDVLGKKSSSNSVLKGGRKEGLTLLESVQNLKEYEVTRNLPSHSEGTSHLSAHHKFGTVSIREVYQTALHFLGPDSSFLTELYWRDFFSHIAFHFPHVFGHAFRQKYDKLPWKNDKKVFEKWCEGKTGFPIVDAGMRELNQTGYMHNRVRMIVACFLIKDLHVDWRWGEQYFARHLLDYDPAVNNGNWQWAASTGCDAQPYFRIFNPQLQHRRYDPDSDYVKQWVPELKALETKEILKLYEFKMEPPKNYPTAIVEHKEVTQWAKEIYKLF